MAQNPAMPSPGSTLAVVARPTSATPDDALRFIARVTRDFTLATLAHFAAGSIAFALIDCVQPILPVLGRDFGVDAATASLSRSATTRCLAASLPEV